MALLCPLQHGADCDRVSCEWWNDTNNCCIVHNIKGSLLEIADSFHAIERHIQRKEEREGWATPSE